MPGTYLRNLPWLKTPIDAQRLDLLFGGATGSALVGFIEAFILSSLFWQDIAGGLVAAWLALFLCVRLGRVALAKAYWRARPVAPAGLARWGWWVVVSASVQALAWSLGAFVLMAPDNLVAEWALHLGLAAVAHASAVRLAQHGPGVLAYVIGIFVPLLVRDLWVGQPSHWLLAGVTLLIAAYVLSSGIRQTMAILDAMRQRQRNAELIEALEAENTARHQAQHQAEAAHAAKARFLAAISHDLRQPLHAMGLLAHTLQGQVPAGTVNTLSTSMAECVTHMTDLVDALMDQSRLEANALVPNLRAFALADVLMQVQLTLQPLAQHRGLTLSIDDTTAVVHSDPKLLLRVLVNLVANALRYTDQGRVHLRVAAPLPGTADRLTIDVMDTGRGIGAKDLPHIFDDFYKAAEPSEPPGRPKATTAPLGGSELQAPVAPATVGKVSERGGNSEPPAQITPSGLSAGTGLGLANVRRLALLLDLQLTVASTPGQGSTFGFSLPQGVLVAQPPAASAPPHDATLAGQRVLVVDDDPTSRLALQAQLGAWGCTVTLATGAAQALALINAAADAAAEGAPSRLPHAVILDLHLGAGLNGVALAGALRERWHVADLYRLPAPALLLITAEPGHPLAQQASTHMTVLGKPLPAMRLRAFLAGVQAQRVPIGTAPPGR